MVACSAAVQLADQIGAERFAPGAADRHVTVAPIAQGRLHGPYRRLYLEESPYADSRIREERGHFTEGHPVGAWTFHSGDGAVLCEVERGALPAAERLDELADESLGDLVQARAHIERCFSDGRVREALWPEEQPDPIRLRHLQRHSPTHGGARHRGRHPGGG